jgi:hypothetical protein
MEKPSMLIKVRESEFKPLLDPDKTIADIKEHLSPWIDLIRDVTNYGSNLIPRCFSSSERSMKDAVVLAILLRQVVAMLDGVEILLSNAAAHAAQLQMRALFEASVYIDWILESDSEKKAAYYYVHNLRRKRLWASRTQAGSAESQEFIAMMNKSGVQISDKIRESSRQQIQEIDRVLSQPKLAEINKDFEKHRKGKRHDPAWYVPLGQRSLGTIARKVDKASQYTILYSGASEVMHTSSYEHHVRIGKGELTFQPIRSLEGFQYVLRVSVSIALFTFRRILKEYRDGEIPAFSRKYLEKWQREFMNFPQIKFETETTRI